MIYHIVTESDFRAQLKGPVYLPSSLSDDGFVHCALESSVVPVANDYYAGASGRLLLVEIDPRRLVSETRYEAASPTAGGGSSHLASASQFPHVYGPINTEAITGVGVLGRTVGGYEWPRGFMPLDSFLTIDGILAAYDWFEHPDGPYFFVETHRDAHRTSGHWLFLPGGFSSFHKVCNNEELWLIHLGRVLVHVLDPDGAHHVLRLGTDLAAGERPVVAVPVNYWQAAEIPEGTPFAFGTNVCAPPFSYEEFAIARREELLREFPDHADLIIRLTRED